jgi:hypothetical protein
LVQFICTSPFCSCRRQHRSNSSIDHHNGPVPIGAACLCSSLVDYLTRDHTQQQQQLLQEQQCLHRATVFHRVLAVLTTSLVKGGHSAAATLACAEQHYRYRQGSWPVMATSPCATCRCTVIGFQPCWCHMDCSGPCAVAASSRSVKLLALPTPPWRCNTDMHVLSLMIVF